MTNHRIYAPDGMPGPVGTELARIPPALAGLRITALDNGKPGADELLSQLGAQLARRTGAIFTGLERKGSAATPCEDPLLEALVRSADLILTGTAD
jgi:hypothetical protein